MKPPNFISFFVVLCFGLLENLFAQEAPQIVPGTRIRVLAPPFSRDRLVGTVASISADTLVVKVENEAASMAIRLVSVTRLEVSRGRVGRGINTLKGAGIGLLVGAGVGALVGLGQDDPSNNEITGGTWALLGIAVGGGVGLVTGATIGTLRNNERWEKVPLERLRVRMAPSHGGISLSGSFAL